MTHLFSAPPRQRRGFLFLQGLASRFFESLGRRLAERGHLVRRVNFNGGDRAFWRLPGAVDFTGRPQDWPGFFDGLLSETGIGEVILFGDCRPLHRAAIALARRRRIAVRVVEEGYLRPGWITFEAGGVNAYSALPREPAWYRERARALPPWREPPLVEGSFRRRAAEDLLYAAASFAARRRFPHYRTHRPYFALIEYAGWARRLALRRRAEKRAAADFAELGRSGAPYYLFPLQLDCDYQIRAHSPDRTMQAAIERVVGSFAAHAPARSRLVVKLHPLDSGLVDWAGITRHLAAAAGVAERVLFLDGGEIAALLACCRGVATVNSTMGARALARGVPVKALARPVYDLPGLTFAGGLDDFWHDPTPPDMALFDAFRRVLAATALIPGDFFSERGIELAAAAALARLEGAEPAEVAAAA
ncbi:MAG TPA: capsular biosynthesis protein [Stellaceae bacterium]|nr:capsular biosynthesis protein [Stellaceae bacterium]